MAGAMLLFDRATARLYDVAKSGPAAAELKHDDRIEHAAFSDDGLRIVTASADGSARIWDAATGQPVGPVLKHKGAVHFAAFNHRGNHVVTGGADKTARIWDLASGKRVMLLEHRYTVHDAAFSVDGHRLVTIVRDLESGANDLTVWASAPGPRPLVYRLPPRGGVIVRWATFTPDASHVIWQSANRTVHEWDYQGNPLRRPGRQVGPGVPNVRADREGALSADSRQAIKVDGPAARVYELETAQPTGPTFVHGSEIMFAALSRDGRLALTAGRDWSVRVWDRASGQLVAPPLRHGSRVTSAWFDDSGSRLLTLALDGTLRVWDLSLHELASPIVQLGGGEHTVISPDGTLTAGVDGQGAIWVRDAVTQNVVRGPLALDGRVTDLVFAPDGRRLLARGGVSARVWDAKSGEPLTPVLRVTGSPQQMLFTPDSSHVVLVGSDRILEIYNVGPQATVQKSVRVGSTPWSGATLSPDGLGVVVTNDTQSVAVHDTLTGKPRLGPIKHAAPVTHAAFSPDGKRLAVATAEGTAFVWDTEGRPATAPLSHGHPLHQVVFSGDGRRVVTVADDRTLRLWDVATGQALTPVLSQPDPIETTMLSLDGHRLVTVSPTGAGRVWDLGPDPRPVPDLVRLTQVLSGAAVDPQTGGFKPLDMDDLRAQWPELRRKYPREFTAEAP